METLGNSSAAGLHGAPPLSGQGANMAPPPQEGQVASTQKQIPKPMMRNESDFDIIENFQGNERNFWIQTLNDAKMNQEQHANLLSKLRQLESGMRKSNGFDINKEVLDDAQTVTSEMEGIEREIKNKSNYLFELNKKIQKYNKDAKRDTDLGLVKACMAIRPKLIAGSNWDVINNDPSLQSSLAKPYYEAYKIQGYTNDYHAYTTNDNPVPEFLYDNTREDGMIEALEQINNYISLIRKVKKYREDEKDEDFAAVYVIQQGDEEIDLKNIEEDIPEEKDAADKDKELEGESFHKVPNILPTAPEQFPQEILEYRQELAFYLPQYIQNNCQDAAAEKKILKIQNNAETWCNENNLSEKKDLYLLTNEQFQTMNRLCKEAQHAFKAATDISNSNHQEAVNQYRQMRKVAIDLCCREYRFPQILADQIVPSEEYAGQMIKLIEEQQRVSEELKKSQEAQRVVIETDMDIDTVEPPKEREEEESPQTPTNESEEEESPRVQNKSLRRKPKAKSSSKPKSYESKTTNVNDNVPPPGVSLENAISIDSTPGVVLDHRNGQPIEKRIIGYLKAGCGHQLLLKSSSLNPGRYSYELVAASKFKGSLEVYKRNGGAPMQITGKKFLTGRTFEEFEIAAVASVRRSGDKSTKWKNEAKTYVGLKLKRGNEFHWMAETHVSEKFGQTRIRSYIVKYRKEAGQKMPRAATERVFTNKKKNYICPGDVDDDDDDDDNNLVQEEPSISIVESEGETDEDSDDSDVSNLIDDSENEENAYAQEIANFERKVKELKKAKAAAERKKDRTTKKTKSSKPKN